MKKNISYLATAVLMSLSLAACGGGGGGSSSTPTTGSGGSGSTPESLSLTAINTASSVEENARATFEFSISGAQGNVVADYTLSNVDAPVDITVSETSTSVTVNMSVDEMVKSNENATLTVEVTDGEGRTEQWSGDVALINSSGEALMSKIKSMSASAQSYAGLNQEVELAKRLEEAAVLLNDNYAPTGLSLEKQVESAAANKDTANYLNYWAEDYLTLVESYQAGKAKEEQFADAESSLIQTAQDHLAGAVSALQKAVGATDGFLAPLTVGKVFVSESGQLSQFAGNPDLGEYVDGQWVFNEEYRYLDAIAFPNSQQCAAE